MSRSPQRIKVDQVDWLEVLPALRLVEAGRAALWLRPVVATLIGLLVLHAGGRLLDWAGSGGVYRELLDATLEAGKILVNGVASELVGGVSHGESMVDVAAALGRGVAYGWNESPWSLSAIALWALVVWVIFGGWVARLIAGRIGVADTTGTIAAAEAAKTAPPKSRPASYLPALLWVSQRQASLFMVVLGPLLVAGMLAGVIALLGLLLRVPVLEWVGAAGYGVLLLLGVVAALILLGLAAGLLLLFPALAIEDADGFDIVSRVYNYVLFHPLHVAVYAGVTVVTGVLLYLLLGGVLALGAALVFWLTGGAGRGDGGVGSLIEAWEWLLGLVLLASMLSYLMAAATWTYLLLRRTTDGVHWEGQTHAAGR